MLLKFMLIGISISLGYGNSIYNNSTENLEFCLYTKNSVIKTINPFYVDLDSDKTIYFNNIEEYTKYLGPNWAGVSYCGNNTLVNYVGEYYKIKNKKYESTTDNSFPETNDENIYKGRTLDDYRKMYKKLYDDLILAGFKKCRFNKDLIKVKNIRYTNMVTTSGIPENEDKGKDIKECGSFQLIEGSTYTCSVAYTNEVQDTISISNSRGTSYHKSYGKVYSKAHALSGSKSISKSLSDGGSSSIEKVYTVVNSNSKALSDTRESSHEETNERSILHIESENQSRATINSKENSKETNWSSTHEKSHTDEYTHMNSAEYKAVADARNEYRNITKGLSNFEKGVAGEMIGKGTTLSKRWVQLISEILGILMAAKQNNEGKAKSFFDIEFSGFVGSVIPFNYDIDRFNFIKEVKNTVDTLESGTVFVPGQYITSSNKKYSFGLLCEGASVKEGCIKVWSNGITSLDPAADHDLKFFIGSLNVDYSDEFIDIMNAYIKFDEDHPNTSLTRIQKSASIWSFFATSDGAVSTMVGGPHGNTALV
ncbi:hypothetical protein H8356DRAFT_1356416 [Neocallimastix lanati (nom. inval.)]|nr:hypothetical protein H8356DRAFT_1356416 [Neocallimastix sp. JGI-2020a]